MRNRNVHEVSQEKLATQEDEEEVNELFVEEISTKNNKLVWLYDLIIGKVKIPFKIDTGADSNIISFNMFKELSYKLGNNAVLNKTKNVVKAFGGSTIKVVGVAKLACKYLDGKNNEWKDALNDFYVVNMDCTPLIGLKTCLDMELLDNRDETLGQLIKYINNGWTDFNIKKCNSVEIKHFYNLRHNLFFKNDIVLLDDRIIIPEALKDEMLIKIHGNVHFGIIKNNSSTTRDIVSTR
ncbi:unnamed protein product [Ceutorhynchus assimilis]|uniref:Peptidase A2 domain-containing protein n=1 Tax=Ceutorhynchus assimilis TaxID=467358 RepID=A0A9N9QMP0_9CUCU|nr:unnamed protein product [Ceutorhynchus assimilis]